MAMSLVLAQNATADALLSTNPAALLTGMLLDQQFPMESAFAGPQKIAERMGGEFDIEAIAHADPDEFAALCSQTPAVHRYPGSMAKRIQALCAHLLEAYDGRAEGIWTDGDPDGKDVFRRLKALPGFGDQKARIFLALLGKQLGVALDGWREAAGAYGEQGSRRSIADVTDAKSLMEVREFKQEQKRAAKADK